MMSFVFLIVCRATPEREIDKVVGELLAQAKENIGGDFEDDALACVVSRRHQRFGDESTDNHGQTTRQVITDIILNLEATKVAKDLVREFIVLLNASPVIHHIVKFEDPLLQEELAYRASEIFALEMKLRRVLSFIYLHAYQGKDPYDLLRDETVSPMGSPKLNQMQSATENQFFHLTFGNYAALNQRREIRFNDLLEILRDADTYEKFYEEFSRVPIAHEDDSELLAGLRNLMDAIEKMRNCVAHNRRPSTRLTANYNNALPQLHEMLDNCLSRWDFPLDLEEMPWDRAAREAVERVLEDALWDHEAKTIRLNDYGARETATSLDELQEILEQVASQAYYANVPYEDGEPVFQCDEYGVVESVLSDDEERLTEFFEGNGTDEFS